MNGKDYVNQAIDLAQKVLAGIIEANMLDGSPLTENAQKAIEDLNQLKNKATLRTKDGTNFAFPVYEAAQNLDEAWEDEKINNNIDDLKWRLEGFIDSAVALGGILKERTVIMT